MAYFQPSTVSYFCLPNIKGEFKSTGIEEIISKVAALFEVEEEMLYAKVRYPHVKYARWIVWKIMLTRGLTLSEIGRLLGNFDHTTVINAMDKIDADIASLDYVGEVWKQVSQYCGNVEYKKKSRIKKI